MVARALRKLGLQPPRRWLTKMMQVLTTRIELLVMVAENRLGMEIQTVKEVAACVLCLGHLQQPLPDPQPVFEVQHPLYKWKILHISGTIFIPTKVCHLQKHLVERDHLVWRMPFLFPRQCSTNKIPPTECCTFRTYTVIHWQSINLTMSTSHLCHNIVHMTAIFFYLEVVLALQMLLSDACLKNESCTQVQSCRNISHIIFAPIWCHRVEIFILLSIPTSIASFTALHRIWDRCVLELGQTIYTSTLKRTLQFFAIEWWSMVKPIFTTWERRGWWQRWSQEISSLPIFLWKYPQNFTEILSGIVKLLPLAHALHPKHCSVQAITYACNSGDENDLVMISRGIQRLDKTTKVPRYVWECSGQMHCWTDFYLYRSGELLAA